MKNFLIKKTFISIFFILISFLFFSCAKKEIPPIFTQESLEEVSPYQEYSTKKETEAPELPPEVKFPPIEEEEEFLFEENETALKEQELEKKEVFAKEEKDMEYYKKYGRGTPPLLAIFFDFDDYRIREDMWERIKQNVVYLLKHPEVKIQLQGNCDERGTSEYNFALGAKRALEVKKVIVKLGVNPDRISTISFGKERPLCTEKTEECWALNRRVDFVILK